MQRTKTQVQTDLNLATEPTDELMQLLAQLGDSDVVEGPLSAAEGKGYSPEDIEGIVVEGTIGDLIARARAEAHASLAAIGKSAGVTRARVQQLEHSANVEISTLVRIAAACGYDVSITLEPHANNRRPLSTKLSGDSRSDLGRGC